jgi:hypothetical protein
MRRLEYLSGAMFVAVFRGHSIGECTPSSCIIEDVFWTALLMLLREERYRGS